MNNGGAIATVVIWLEGELAGIQVADLASQSTAGIPIIVSIDRNE